MLNLVFGVLSLCHKWAMFCVSFFKARVEDRKMQDPSSGQKERSLYILNFIKIVLNSQKSRPLLSTPCVLSKPLPSPGPLSEVLITVIIIFFHLHVT